jgi:hypothetical protein
MNQEERVNGKTTEKMDWALLISGALMLSAIYIHLTW